MTHPSEVVCPTCGATGGEECLTRSGRDHPRRRQAIAKAATPRENRPTSTPVENRPDEELSP